MTEQPTEELTVCSNRGPALGEQELPDLVAAQSGPGGLVPVVSSALGRLGGRWIFAPSSDSERALARAGAARRVGNVTLQTIDVPSRLYEGHYQIVSIEYLGLLFHYLFPLTYSPVFDGRFARAWGDYKEVNKLFAQTIANSLRGPLSVQDYHLMLVGAQVRSLVSDIRGPMVYFHHLPWCDPHYFSLLPGPVRHEILAGLLSHDVVSFHSPRWARAFQACCADLLPDSVVSHGGVEWRDRNVRVHSSPATLDVSRIKELAGASLTQEWLQRFTSWASGRWTLVRVDRADLWKNIIRGFLAFEELLKRRPGLVKEIWFLAVIAPTRMWLPEYQAYLQQCIAVADRINEAFGASASGKGPITLLVADDPQEPDHNRALAALQTADAVLVNPIFDGLNLVAKEGMIVSERNAVLILSENAGVYEEIGRGAIGINPFDLISTADAIETAFQMPESERISRAEVARRLVTARTPEDWIQGQLRASI